MHQITGWIKRLAGIKPYAIQDEFYPASFADAERLAIQYCKNRNIPWPMDPSLLDGKKVGREYVFVIKISNQLFASIAIERLSGRTCLYEFTPLPQKGNNMHFSRWHIRPYSLQMAVADAKKEVNQRDDLTWPADHSVVDYDEGDGHFVIFFHRDTLSCEDSIAINQSNKAIAVRLAPRHPAFEDQEKDITA